MDWLLIQRLEPSILLGIVNEKLRLECEDLEELASAYDLDLNRLRQRLGSIGYHYEAQSNQFRMR